MIKRKLLIIGHIFPETKATAAGWRMMKLIRLFSADYQVVFATAAQKSSASDELESLSEVIHLPLNDDAANEILLAINPSVVVFDRFYTEEMFGWRVAEILPNAWRVLNSEDLHFLRASREQWTKKNNTVSPLFLADELLVDNTTRELASMMRCHKSLIISSAEMQILKDHFDFPIAKLSFIPLQLPDKHSFFSEDKQNFCFIGNGIHKPNADAINWLVSSIWPKIQDKLPQAKLNIACSYTTSHLRQLLAKKKNIQLHEGVKDAAEFVQMHKVQLMPIRFGAGIKGKILESMVNETPFVSTSIGLEGICTNYSFQSDQEDQFVALAIELFTNDLAYEKAKTEMKNAIDSYPNIDLLFTAFLKEIQSTPSIDWYAATLLQQQNNATRFFSKYIIEKNKNN